MFPIADIHLRTKGHLCFQLPMYHLTFVGFWFNKAIRDKTNIHDRFMIFKLKLVFLVKYISLIYDPGDTYENLKQ